MNITKCIGLGSNLYWFHWQIVVDKGYVCLSSLVVLLEIALGYQTVEVLQVVMMQTCEKRK